MGSKCKVVFKISIFSVCLGFFLRSALESLKVYNSGLKTMTSTVIPLDAEQGLLFPVLLFCNESGFRNTHSNTKLSDYINNTLTLEQLDIKVSRSVLPNDSTSVAYEIKPVHSAYKGRCYALRILDRIEQQFEYFKISVSQDHILKLYALEPGSEILAVGDIWFQKPLSVTLNPHDSMVDLYVEKRIQQRYENCEPFMNHNFYDLFSQKLKEYYFINNHHFPNCTTPWTQYLIFGKTEYNDSKPCTHSEASEELHLLSNQIMWLLDPTRNSNYPCDTVTYPLGIQSYDRYSGSGLMHDMVDQNIRNLFYFYQSTNIIVNKEILVMGLNDLISAWGGLLGLFLGFSFFGCCLDFYGTCIKFSYQACGKDTTA